MSISADRQLRAASRLRQAEIWWMSSLTEMSKTAEQQVHRSADRGLHAIAGPTPQWIHLNHVHPRQKTCRKVTGVSMGNLQTLKTSS